MKDVERNNKVSIERVREEFSLLGIDDRIVELDASSATVELAAKALGCEPKNIAKSLAFLVGDQPILIVASGHAKIDNAKYKHYFGKKAKMMHGDQVEKYIGHAAGGVCPFGLNEGVKVYLDDSLKTLQYVFPACGSSNSCIKLTIEELERYSHFIEWIDVCR